ncbi:MAG: hypothetical protein WCP97_06585 [bacterium]
MTIFIAGILKIILLVSALVYLLLIAFPVVRNGKEKLVQYFGYGVAILSVFAYFNFGFFYFPTMISNWDTFHYYMGAKYFQELGYTDLYRAGAAATKEVNPASPVTTIRNLTTFELEQVNDEVIADVKGKFTTERWEQFLNDFRFYNDRDKNLWAGLFTDHGYNGMPLQILWAGAIFNLVPLNLISLFLLVSVDWVLAAVALAFVFKAFGQKAGTMATIFFCLNFLTRYRFTGGSLFRFDWICALLIFVCCYRMKQWWGAGVALAFAVFSRFFPLVFAGIVVAKFVTSLVTKNKDVLPGLKKTLLAFLATSVVFGLLSVVVLGRGSTFSDLTKRLQLISGRPFTNSVGVAVVDYYRGEQDGKDFGQGAAPWEQWIKDVAQRRSALPVILGIVAVLLGIFIFLKTDVLFSLLLAIPVLFFFSLMPNYYYLFLVLYFIVVWKKDGQVRPTAAVSMVLFLIITIVSYILEHAISFPLRQYYLISVLLMFSFLFSLLAEVVVFLPESVKKRVLHTFQKSSRSLFRLLKRVNAHD